MSIADPRHTATPTYGDVNRDVLATLRPPGNLYFAWMSIVGLLLMCFLLAWTYQIFVGMGSAGKRVPQMWAMYITTFVFWIGIGHAGTLISAVLYLFRARWRTSIYRGAEAMTIFAVMTAGLFPLIHAGRMWFAYFLLPYPNQRDLWPNFKSPLVWDVFAISTYLSISTVFFIVGLIPDIVNRAKGFSALVARVDETLAKLEAERQVDVLKAPTATPLQRDARFWAGMVLGAAALFTGATVTGSLKYIALLDIPAFGLAALVALKRVEDLQWAELAVRRGDRLGDRERQVRDQFEADAQPVRNAMKILGAEQPHEIVLALEEHGRWAGKLADLEKRVQTARLNPEYIAAATQLAELRAEQEALNARLAEKGSYVRDAREVEREMARMREALAPAPRRVSSPGVPAAGGAEGQDDFTTALMSAAADLLNIDVAALASRIGERCAQYMSALTERRVEGLEFTYDGQCQARVGGKLIPIGQVLSRDVDWVWLGLRLSLLERLVSQEPMPVLLEDMATGMDEARLPLLGRMLKGLGGGTQVLHVTAHPVFASMSDGSLNV